MSALIAQVRPSLRLAAASVIALLTSCTAGSPDDSNADSPDEIEENVDSAGSALTINAPNPHGNLSVVSPPEGPWVFATNGSNWRTIEGMGAVAYAEAGDSLDVGVSAEVQSPGSVWLRALVDGVVAAPSDVLFKTSAGSQWDGVRSFHFVLNNLSAGPHVVEIQWFGHASTQMRDRSLVVHTAHPGSADSALATAAAPSGPSIQTTTTTWQDIPGLSTTITSGTGSEMQIGFSGEVHAAAGQLLVRAVVNGTATGSVRVTEAGTVGHYASRSFMLRRLLPSAGIHNVKLQWSTTAGGVVYMGDRTLTAFTGRNNQPGGSFGASWLDTTAAHAPTTTWADVPLMNKAFSTTDPSSTIAFTGSVEAKASPGRLFLRALLDGQVVNPSDVTLVQGASTFAAYQFAFQAKNVAPGAHTVTFQAMSESGTTASILDRSVTAVAKRRGGGDFAQPRKGQLGGSETRPRHQGYKAIVICMDPRRVDPIVGTIQRKLTPAELRGYFLGTDGGHNLLAWWNENSGGRMSDGGHTFVDCFDAPVAHQGNYYWNTPGGFATMHQDAIQGADPFVNFHSYDLNGNGVLSYDEVVVYIVKPQYGTNGFVQVAVNAPVEGQSMLINYADIYVNPSTQYTRLASVGVIAHESTHLFGTWDQYGNIEVPSTPRTIMSEYGWATHLDPEQKLRSGFLMPDVIEMGSWTTQSVTVQAVETSRGAVLIYDRTRPLEYFIVENRWADVSNYDGKFGNSANAQGLVVNDQDGLVIWRVIRDDVTTDWGAHLNKPVASLNSINENLTLTYRDGTPTKIKVTAQSGTGQTMTALVEKLP